MSPISVPRSLTFALGTLSVVILVACAPPQGQQSAGGGGAVPASGNRDSGERRGGGLFGSKPKVDVPAGTHVSVRLTETVSSETATDGQKVGAEAAQDVTVDGKLVIRSGARVQAHVEEAKSAKRFGGQSSLRVRFDSVEGVDGDDIPLQGTIADVGRKQTGKDTATIAGSAVGGAVLGKVIGGDDQDAAVGAVVGGGIGTAVASRKGDEAVLGTGAEGTAQTTSTESVAVND